MSSEEQWKSHYICVYYNGHSKFDKLQYKTAKRTKLLFLSLFTNLFGKSGCSFLVLKSDLIHKLIL